MTDLADGPPAQRGMTPAGKGTLLGMGAVLIWGGYMAYARLGISSGLTGMDFLLLRYGVAAIIVMPWLAFNSPLTLAGVGWRRGAILSLLAGPPFILLSAGGYAFAPLAHGAVFQPATVVITTTLLAVMVMGERLTRDRLFGMGIIVCGLAVIAGPSLLTGSVWTPVGDLMFVAAGILWACFTVLARYWDLPSLPTTVATAVISGFAAILIFLPTQDFSRIAALPPASLFMQVVIQGVLSGVVAVVLFTKAAELVGSSRAGTFPALVPAAAVLVGIPVTGELPTLWQVAGLVLVSIGLLVGVGAISGRKANRS